VLRLIVKNRWKDKVEGEGCNLHRVTMVSFKGIVGAWVRKLWQCDCTHWLSLKINNDKNKRLKNLPMN